MNIKRTTFLWISAIVLTVFGLIVLEGHYGIGHSSMNNEAIVQVKKITAQTPLLCYKNTQVDVSFGVMQNGVGSMSTQDELMYVADSSNVVLLNNAAAAGKLVKLHYNTARVNWCVPEQEITSVEIIQ